MKVIEVKNLSYNYQTSELDVPVLKNLSFDISRNEMVAICGRSGSGKSTLLYVLGCLLTTYRGHVKIFGEDLQSLNDQELAYLRNRKIGFVFQQFCLLPHLSVVENVELAKDFANVGPPEQRANELLTTLQLSDHAGYFPGQLSGGQQQRVAIARALFMSGDLILADEPTGSLDSQSAKQVMAVLHEAHRNGSTVVVITHDAMVAKECQRIIEIEDGQIKSDSKTDFSPAFALNTLASSEQLGTEESGKKINQSGLAFSEDRSTDGRGGKKNHLLDFSRVVKLAMRNIFVNRTRSALTMLGVAIGVAAVFSMLTLGRFTQDKIMESYNDMGVNDLIIQAYDDYSGKLGSRVFTGFQFEEDATKLRQLFSSIQALSPLMHIWQTYASYAGVKLDKEVFVQGVSAEGLFFQNRELLIGRPLSDFHVQAGNPVCVIGYQLYAKLFNRSANLKQILKQNFGQNKGPAQGFGQNKGPAQGPMLGQNLQLARPDLNFGCRVIGVLKSQPKGQDWADPDLKVFIPYTYAKTVANAWERRVQTLMIKVRSGEDVELVGNGIRKFLSVHYGSGVEIHLNTSSILVAKMKRFMGLFRTLLAAIAFLSLLVGGIGVMNMMMVSISERLREIGVKKAYGACQTDIRRQYLTEAMVLCGLAGVVGIAVGFIFYETLFFVGSRLVRQIQFSFVFDGVALSVAMVSSVLVGLLSGLVPARRAERLQVIEALRSE